MGEIMGTLLKAEGANADVPPRVPTADNVEGGGDESALSILTPWPSL